MSPFATPFYEQAHARLADELRPRVRAVDWSSDDPADVVAKLGILHVFPLLAPAPDSVGAGAPAPGSVGAGAPAPGSGGAGAPAPGSGGAGAPHKSVRALCVAREILAYASPMADAIFAVQGLASHPLAMAGAEAWRDRIEDVVRGRTVGGFALTEPEAGSDVASMRAVARRDGEEWRLDGEKTFISNVGIAHFFVVFANADPSRGKKGISAFLVEADAPGLTLEPIATVDDHPLGRLVMRGARARLVGEPGQGLRLALGTLDVFRTSVGAAAVGMAQRALDEALAHVKRRVQFGRPLAEFQLVQAALAEMATELDAARLLVARAAWAKDTGRAGKMDVAMAKMFATEAAQRIVDRAVQLLGGLGVVRGGAVERLYRSVRSLRIYEGTTEIQKLIIGGALVESGAEGGAT